MSIENQRRVLRALGLLSSNEPPEAERDQPDEPQVVDLTAT
jgi:hypothetical protein